MWNWCASLIVTFDTPVSHMLAAHMLCIQFCFSSHAMFPWNFTVFQREWHICVYQAFQFPFKPGEESYHIMSSVSVVVNSMAVEKGFSANWIHNPSFVVTYLLLIWVVHPNCGQNLKLYCGTLQVHSGLGGFAILVLLLDEGSMKLDLDLIRSPSDGPIRP
jgi:hypothetical protein